MTEVTLHPTPRLRDVVLEQLRVVGLGLRREALVVLAVLAIGTVLVGTDLAQGGPGFDSGETFPTQLIAFFFPFLVWRLEPRFGPTSFWTLPCDRRRLALAKAFAGFVWLMAAVGVFVVWLLALGLLADAPPARTILRIPLVATITLYLFGSAVVLGLRHPLRWLCGAAGVVFVMGTLSDRLARPDDGEWSAIPGAHAWFSLTERLWASFHTLPPIAQSAIVTFLAVGAGLAALWIAASRHRDLRRR